MQNEGGEVRFRRVLGIWTGASTLAAVVIGAGIFSVPQRVAEYLGGTAQILILWTAVGLMCLATSLVFAEIAGRFPKAGADYLALRSAYGRRVAFLFGWRGFAITQPSNRAALALVGAQYLAVLLPSLAGAELLVAGTLIVTLIAINASGARQATMVHVAVTVIKVGLLLVFVVWAATAFFSSTPMEGGSVVDAGSWWSSPPSDVPVLQRWALASILIFFSYTGFGQLVQVSEEFRDPQRVLPRVMVVGMGGIIGLYLVINYAYIRLLGIDGVRDTSTVGADAMEIVFGPVGALLVAFLIVVSVAGSMSVSIMAASRLHYSMAAKGDFFRFLARLHRRTRVPTRALVVHLVLALVFLVVRRNFVDLILSATFLNLIFFALRVQSLFVLRRRGLGAPGGFRLPWYPWLPLAVLTSMYAVLITRIILDWERAWFDLAVLLVGLAVSQFWIRGEDDPAPARVPPP